MKRIIMAVLAIAVMLMAFTSCRQVYIPWPLPGTGDDTQQRPAGDPINSADNFEETIKYGGTFYLADDIRNMPTQLNINIENGMTLVIDGNKKTISRDVGKSGDVDEKAIVQILSGNVILKNMTIDGINPPTEGWNPGEFGIKVYGQAATVTLENVTVTNCNAGILVDGSTVTLNGTINLSGNYAGGINVDKKAGKAGTVNIRSGATIDCTDNGKPAIWLDDNTGRGIINDDTKTLQKFENQGQIWYLTPSQVKEFGGTLNPINQ